MMKVTAAVLKQSGENFNLEDVQLEEPRDDELLVKMVGVGVCHTDVMLKHQQISSPLPVVLGHEGSGVVVKVGSKVTEFAPGDHVVMSYGFCGKCPACMEGQYFRCRHAMQANFGCCRMDGSTPLSNEAGPVHGHFFAQSSFSTYTLAEEKTAVKVPNDLPLELLGPLGCGLQTGSGAVINTLAPKVGSSIVVFGCGAVGLSAVMAAMVCGCTRIIAVDFNPSRLALASELGATYCLNPAEHDDLITSIMTITGGADYSVECVGNPKVLRQAVDCLAAHGACAMVGATAVGTEVNLDMNSLMMGRSIKGVIEGDAVPKTFIPTLIELYQQGRFPLDKLIKTYSFFDINQAFADVEAGGVIKAVLLFDQA